MNNEAMKDQIMDNEMGGNGSGGNRDKSLDTGLNIEAWTLEEWPLNNEQWPLDDAPDSILRFTEE